MEGADPLIVEKLRAALARTYGERIERVVLYGSRARHTAQENSDYDIAVFLKGMPDRWQEIDTLGRIGTELLDETGAIVNALPFRAESYSASTPLMREIRNEGTDL